MTAQRLTWRWRLLARIAIGLVRLLGFRIRVEGLEHVPRRGGAVLAFNHHSYADFVMAAWAPVRRLRRPIRFLAKQDIWANRWSGWAVRWAGAVPVDRGSATGRAGALDAAVAALRAGDLVAVAPEQTISPSFELLPFRTGAVRMAQEAGVPIVPTVGWGSHRFATKGRRPRLALGLPVVVRYGRPFHVAPGEDPVGAITRLEAVMADVLDDVQRGYAGGTPVGAWWVPRRLGGGAPAHDEVLREHPIRWEDRGGRDSGGPEGV